MPKETDIPTVIRKRLNKRLRGMRWKTHIKLYLGTFALIDKTWTWLVDGSIHWPHAYPDVYLHVTHFDEAGNLWRVADVSSGIKNKVMLEDLADEVVEAITKFVVVEASPNPETRTIKGLARLYGVKEVWHSPEGLVGVYNEETDYYDWHRFEPKSRAYRMTGSTRDTEDATPVEIK